MNGELCLCKKKVPDSTKLHLIKGQKTKFPQGSIPRTPLVCHMLCTRMRTCSPNNLYNLIPPPLGQKAELYPGIEIHTYICPDWSHLGGLGLDCLILTSCIALYVVECEHYFRWPLLM